MSTEKNLADVQPGGRVRLGDQADPSEDGWGVLARIDSAIGYLTTALDDLDSSPDRRPGIMVTEAIAVLRETLAAQPSPATCKEGLQVQPSPGGQGDALLDQARKLFDELGAIADDYRCVAILAAALAARQPVGQEPAYNAAGLSLTACQLHEALLMAGDPELDVPFEDRGLVRIFWTEAGHSGPGLYCECVDAEEEGCILLDGTAPAIQQPAQAVDLGRFRKLASWVVNCAGHGINDSQRRMGEELLALIDSQAVCK